jgi:hypothetical protein
LLSILVADENTNSLQKPERKNIGKCPSYAPLNFGRLLDIRHHLESDKKLLCPTEIQATIKKQRKHVQNSLSYSQNISFSAI